MNRISTTLITLTASALFLPLEASAQATLDSLNSRMIAIESRLAALEKSLGGNDTPSYTYEEQATLEATGNDVPTAPQSSQTYVIKDGDTLGSIARNHGVERSALLEANRLSEGQPIYIGETLLIPGSGEIAAPEPGQSIAEAEKPAPATEKSVVVGETKAPAPSAPSSSKTHVVVKGDTLTAIAAKYGTDVPSLKSANGLKSDVISLGQKLTLPSGGTKVAETTKSPSPTQTSTQEASYEYDNPLLKADETYGYYTVRKGDNLYALARDFFTNMPELQRLNRLGSSTIIYPGNELIVPTGKYNDFHKADGMAQR